MRDYSQTFLPSKLSYSKIHYTIQLTAAILALLYLGPQKNKSLAQLRTDDPTTERRTAACTGDDPTTERQTGTCRGVHLFAAAKSSWVKPMA